MWPPATRPRRWAGGSATPPADSPSWAGARATTPASSTRRWAAASATAPAANRLRFPVATATLLAAPVALPPAPEQSLPVRGPSYGLTMLVVAPLTTLEFGPLPRGLRAASPFTPLPPFQR